MLPYGRQSISDSDIEAVIEVLKSDWLTQGPVVTRFEEAVANYCGAGFGVSVTNATSGLHLACLALELGPGDLLWTSPITFVASANCGRYCGADVDFVDIDPKTYNISVTALREKLVRAEREGRLPKMVVAVHFSGQACEMEAIQALAKQYGFYLIEDAAHAIGGSYQDSQIGSCQYSDLTVFSFHPVKVMTTGEGGMVMTNNEVLHQRLVELRSHGITRDPDRMVGVEDEGGWYYQQLALGYNFRMTDMQSALGLSQLQRLDEFVARRCELAQRYNDKLAGLPLVTPWQHPEAGSAWHLYIITLNAEAAISRRQLYDELRAAGVGVNVHYIPVHLQPYYRQLGFNHGDHPVAEAYYEQALTLPLFPGMDERDQDRVVDLLNEVLI